MIEWVAEEAREHINWCDQFGIEVGFEDAFGDVVDTETEGFASKDWLKVSLACHLLGFHDFTTDFMGRSHAGVDGRVVEVVFRPSLFAWLVRRAGGNDPSAVVNAILANARLVDWVKINKIQELAGDGFLLADRSSAAETNGYLVRMGRAVRLDPDDFDELIDKCRNEPRDHDFTGTRAASTTSGTPVAESGQRALETAAWLKQR